MRSVLSRSTDFGRVTQAMKASGVRSGASSGELAVDGVDNPPILLADGLIESRIPERIAEPRVPANKVSCTDGWAQ